MRTISNSIMAALVVAALFWGNCFSCPQLLLTLKSNQPAHGCCHHTKQTTDNCPTQVLRQFVKADSGTDAPAASMVVTAVVESPVAIALPRGSGLASVPVEHAAPDLLSFHSNFRV